LELKGNSEARAVDADSQKLLLRAPRDDLNTGEHYSK